MKQIILYSLITLSYFITLCSDIVTKPVMLIIATRPDGIKMAPVYQALKELQVPVVICSTDQHTNLLQNVIELFNTKPDFSLQVMKPGQDLFHITNTVLSSLKSVYEQAQPSLVLVQGDTTSAMAAALAAFYCKIPVGHIEAGLRTYNRYGPFPEEINRRIISVIAQYHFAPTQLATDVLLNEGFDPKTIFLTGNTVVDALHSIQHKIATVELVPTSATVNLIEKLKTEQKTVCLLTVHRRESFGQGLEHIFTAIKEALIQFPQIHIIYPVHPNPAIKAALESAHLHTCTNISIVPSLSYTDLVYVLGHAQLVITDSGGIQEEAISLQKPVLVLRKETERMEGVLAGLAVLVGDDESRIIEHIRKQIFSKNILHNQLEKNIYGDGTAGKQIALLVKQIINT